MPWVVQYVQRGGVVPWPGFAGSNDLTVPCSIVSNVRLTDNSACDNAPHVVAVGDPPVTSVTGEKFDLSKTGWSTFVQIPKDVIPTATPKLSVTGDVLLFVGGNCALAFLQNLKIADSQMENHEVPVRAGLEQSPSSLSF